MMSISQVSSAGAASSYYQGDNYYAKGGDEGQGQWFGQGAAELDLEGKPVDPEVFEKVMSGELPNGQKLYRMNKGEKEHIAGYDITFSAPKSVSIMALVVGKEEFEQAHNEAVEATLRVVERDFLRTRVWNKNTSEQDVKGEQGMLAALFTHDISRSEDPQLHTHCVIANASMDERERFRSVHSLSLFQNKMLIGEIYRSHLKSNIARNGMGKIKQTHADGRFELDGMSRSLIDAFSTRSKEMDEYLGEGPHTAEDRAKAALRTRKGKKDTARSDLKSRWEHKLLSEGHTKKGLSKEIEVPFPDRMRTSLARPDAATSLNFAVEHLAETSSTFEAKDVLRFALAHGNGLLDYDRAKEGLSDAIARGWLQQSEDGRLLFTEATLEREKKTLTLEQRGRSSVDPILPRNMVSSRFGEDTLSAGQEQAARLILTSPNRTVGVQGNAGTGKTFMLASVASQAKDAGYKSLGLAPTSGATKKLGEDAGIKSQTLQRFLLSPSGNDKTILFIDEASFISTHQMVDLLSIAAERQIAKVVLIGDTKQLNGVAAGAPFKMLRDNEMRCAVMDEIKRQSKDRHLDAVKGASKGDIERAFHKLGSDIREVPLEALAAETAKTWLEAGDRENAAVVVTTNAMADAVNLHIKEGLIKEGAISENAYSLTIFKSLRLSEAQRRFADNFREADYVRFHRSYDGLGVSAGDTLEIHSVRNNGVIELKKDGRIIPFKPSQHAQGSGAVEAFRSETLKINEGDRIRWTRSDYVNDIQNMDTGQISKIDGTHVTVSKSDGTSVSYPKDHIQLSFLKHGWAQTGHAYQGQTIDHVIVAMPSISGLTNQKSFYVDISRARHEVSFLTDDIDRLKTTLKARTGEERTALDLAAEKDAKLGFDGRSTDQTSQRDEPVIDRERTKSPEISNPSRGISR